MRVPTTSFPTTLIHHLGRLTARQQRLQTEVATGQKVRLPQDDPAAIRRALDLSTQSQTVTQYRSNIGRLQEQSTVSYDAMRALKNLSDRAGEIAVLADGSKSPEQLRTYATEVREMIQQALNLANAKHRGDYIFGGVKPDSAPFVAVKGSEGQITAVNFQGGQTVSSVEIAEDTTVTAQVLGANPTGSGPRGLLSDSRAGADFFGHLIALRNHLEEGNTGAIASNTLEQLQHDEENFLYHFSEVSALQTRLETTDAVMKGQGAALEGLVGKEVDADLAETLVRLNETQNAYRAALQSGAGILDRSLMDFLR